MSTRDTRAKLPRGIVPFRGRYRVRMDYEGTTHSLGVFQTLTDAKAALHIAKADAARGTFVPPTQRRTERQAAAVRAQEEAMTLGEWSEKWLANLEADPERSRATVVSYRSVLRNHVLPDLSDVRLIDLTTERRHRPRWPRSLRWGTGDRRPDARPTGPRSDPFRKRPSGGRASCSALLERLPAPAECDGSRAP